ncbi:MAG TPA: sigma-70 family RNA polymerase sigma factor [Usitatibacter sp.]|nr:sigma-70 family RNA polymerase sigma factor [Usitatibacter sp.]
MRQLFPPPGVIGDDDQALVLRCRQGDRAAFAGLVMRYQRPLYNAAFRIVGNSDDAADVTQSVFLKVAVQIDEYDPQYKFFSWIYRIAVNESLNLVRRSGREEPLDGRDELPGPEAEDPEARASEAQAARRIERTLMGMSTEDRMVLTLRHFSEFSYREIGFILGIEEKTVKSRLFEARQRLRLLLDDMRPG